MNKTKAIILTILTFPIVLALYFTDRVITTPLFWLHQEPMQKWLESAQSVTTSFIRVLVVGLLITIIALLKTFAHLLF